VDGDSASLWNIHRNAMREHVAATWGWDDEAQERRFREHWNADTVQVIERGNRSVGMLAIETHAEEIRISTIEIDPTEQGHGIGSAVVSTILAAARARGLPVTLRVLKVNPARRLYERLGFIVVSETKTHFEMRAPVEILTT
jgi:ribosomal protein S18 acetylase RimI-like enzyme